MSNQSESALRLQELSRLLELYGADKNRWPAADRIRLSSFIAIDPRGKAALAQAAALDRLLDMAPAVSAERERALAERIMAAVAATNPLPSAASNIVPFPAPKKTAIPFLHKQARHAASALLAASLVLGIFAGTSGQLSSTVDYVAVAVGLSEDESELALYTDPSTSAEESL